MKFDNTYVSLPEYFYVRIRPQAVVAPELIFWNQELADFLSIDPLIEKTQVFSGCVVPEGADPLAQAYAGHQFGQFVPQLGDGRAVLLGELRGQDGLLYDVQLKGAGRTPFSRGGDGKSPIGPALREYVVSEFMHRMSVPSTRALAVSATGEIVRREEPQPGAVMTRVASSHVRVGTFQYFWARMNNRQDTEALELLLDYVVNRHAPELLKQDGSRALLFLDWLMDRQASLVAQWMGLGFIHGVMNTDNCSAAGLTLDYGPCAFMDHYKANQVFSFIDRQGRYAYDQQGKIAYWNMVRLAECLAPLVKGSEQEIVESVNQLLGTFPTRFEKTWLQVMATKLGLKRVLEIEVKESSQSPSEVQSFIQDFLQHIEQESLDFTLSFALFAESSAGTDMQKFCQHWKLDERIVHSLSPLLKRYQSSFNGQGSQVQDCRGRNPWYIPRNHQIEKAIQGAEQGNFDLIRQLHTILHKPFDLQEDNKFYLLPPEPEQKIRNTFCGT